MDTLPIAISSDAATLGVLTLTLDQPGRPVVVLDWAFLKQLDATLDVIEREHAGMTGFVLASSSRVFVAGANLEELDQLSDADAHAYLAFGAAVFARIAQMGVTTVAALNGAALGGGLEIALHCDHVIAMEPQPKLGENGEVVKPAKPYAVGLPEAGLGLCPGWGGSAMLPARCCTDEGNVQKTAEAIVSIASGAAPTVHTARELGYVSEIVPNQETLLIRAQELAATEKSAARAHPVCNSDAAHAERVRASLESAASLLEQTEAADAVRRCIEVGLNQGWNAALETERRELVRLRHTPEAKAKREAFFGKGKAPASAKAGA